MDYVLKNKGINRREKKPLNHVDCCPIALLSSVPYAVKCRTRCILLCTRSKDKSIDTPNIDQIWFIAVFEFIGDLFFLKWKCILCSS